MFRRLVAVLALALGLALLPGCKESISDEDLELWSNSSAGWDKISQVVEDPEVTVAIKVAALDKLVMKGNSSKMKDILYTSKFRQELADGLHKNLWTRFATLSGDDKVACKEGLLLILRYLKPEEQATIQKGIADWAFEGLAEGDSMDKVKEQVGERIMLSQVPDLGTFGAQGAAILLSHGFGVERMFAFLRELGKPEYGLLALEAMKKLHKIPNIEISPSHLGMISNLATVDAVNYLIDVYYMETQQATIREDALALAIDMFEKPEIKKASKDMLPILRKIMEQKHPENRRLAGHYILQFGGPGELKSVLEMMKDDAVFNDNIMEVQPFLRDFCRDDVIALPETDYAPVLKAAVRSSNRVARVMALICLKMTANPAYADTFRSVKDDKADVADILGGKLTIGKLAANALSALDRVEGLQAEVKAGTLSQADFAIKKKFYLDELEVADKFLDEIVNIKFMAEKAKGTRPAEPQVP
jgi:hypothetical protein